MTTPDIEKLRGLPEKWRDRAEYYSRLSSVDVYFEAKPRCYKECAEDFEAAGLAELLADYERLLRERS